MYFVLTCAPGLETVAKKEIEIAGYKVVFSWQSFVRFEGDKTAIAKMNLRSRVGNKVFLELKKEKISDFDGLFDLVSTIDRAIYIQDNPILVTAFSKWSQLDSVPTIQSIAKKAIVKKLLQDKVENWELKIENSGKLLEDKNLPPVEILVHFENNECSILLNTTGDSLHKRGYKKATGEAPINEALAAWLLLLSGWKFSEPLYDFFCGSGTIVIEAALIAKNIAPGCFRSFAFQAFKRYDQSIFDKEFEAAKDKIMTTKHHTIIASDIDPRMISIAQENAKHAGVADFITFETKDVKDYLDSPPLDGCLVSNPPYGMRLNIFDTEEIYHIITELFVHHPKLHGGIITSYEKFDTDTWSWSWKKNMFMNGGERCRFYKKTLL